MTKYLFIESRDPFDSRDVGFVADTAVHLKQHGHDVTVFLMQNGVLAARKNAKLSCLGQLAEAEVRVLADDFSLGERGIRRAELHSVVNQSNVDALVDMLVDENTKAIWH